MKTLIILFVFLGLSQMNQTQAQDDSWKSKTAWFSKGTAEHAKSILKEEKSIMYNDHCHTGWGGITISTLKKVWIKESNTGEGNYDLFIKIIESDDSKVETKVHLDWIKIKRDGDWVNLAKVMDIEGDLCGE